MHFEDIELYITLFTGRIKMIKIKYLFHSGFLLETDNKFLVFDYFKDNCTKQNNTDCGQLKATDFPDDKEVIFFVSHAHYDHFDKEIFKLHKNSKYIISNDLRINKDERTITCAPYQCFEVDGVKVRTFGSTDEGLSFLIELDGICIFHAGDLNWWHWEGESEEDKQHAKDIFLKEMEILSKNHVDIAFFPVDPRLEDAYYYGGKYFIEMMKPKIFIPMHFQDCYSITGKFKMLMEKENIDTKIVTMEKRGQLLDI